MRITQIVRTIIGEGLWVGQPCLLVRLSGCNLHCSWCDTPEVHRGGREIPFSELVERGIKTPEKWILLTGGEPLLQRSVGKLVKNWINGKKNVLIETNGTRPIAPVLMDGVSVSMDIKTPSSGEVGKHYNPNLRLLRPVDALKFVISDKKDFDWARDFILKNPTRANLFFQPAWGRLSARRLAGWIIEHKLPVRLSVQIHKILKLP